MFNTALSRMSLTLALGAGLAGLPAAAQAAPAHAVGRTAVVVVSPQGSNLGLGTPRSPLRTLAAAQQRARLFARAGLNVNVELESGTYTLRQPLRFNDRDSGASGRTVTWEAAPGADPVISGGTTVSGWQMHDASQNIYVANVPTGVDSRQLYINGQEAPIAQMSVPHSDFTVTTSGLTINPTAPYAESLASTLDSLGDQSRIEFESVQSFTDHIAPVQSISGQTITMQQPSWQNQNWGYDDWNNPFAGGTNVTIENAYGLLAPGQWYLDPSAGKLYYRAPVGTNPNSESVVLPQLQSLIQVAGTYSQPVQNLTFSGLTFSDTTWLGPTTNVGYADEQNGAFIPSAYTQPSDYLTSCQSGCPLFEATRNGWDQMPAAVQVAAATQVGFSSDTFNDLGEVGLGVGQDADANASGIGLGASDVDITGNSFANLGGNGIVVGGIQPDAHHPSSPAMTNQDITIDDNLVDGVSTDYADTSGILSTYVTHAVIEHNEVENLPYDGIDIGWGWGTNDPGGSQDYENRGLYAYQPVYTTPTTLKNTVVDANRVHATKQVLHDGGSIYNLSADPGAVFSNNYVYDNNHTVGLYLDEGSRYVTLTNNVIQDAGVWAFTNASATNNTDDSVFDANFYNAGVTEIATGAPHNNVSENNVMVTGYDWPAAAQQVIAQAGLTTAVPPVQVDDPNG